MPSVTLLYVPVPSKKVAEMLASALLTKKLIACANIVGPSVSLYHWKGKTERTKEHILLLKTSAKLEKKVRAQIEKLHPYDSPCILSLNVKANQKFASWMTSVINITIAL